MSKRSSIFKQGKPEDPYEDRDEEPADTPKVATAAQMAGRKMKSGKLRRPQGMTSGLAGTISQPSPFAFNAGGGALNNNTTTPSSNPFAFGVQQQQQQQQQPTQNGGIFGGGATSSFPPTQSFTPSDTFASQSFPTFGSNDANTSFNPQPAFSGFNFTAGAGNLFGTPNSAPSMNGAPSTGFAGPTFNPQTSQPQQKGNFSDGFAEYNATTMAPSGSLFDASAAPQPNIFGNIGSSAPSDFEATKMAATLGNILGTIEPNTTSSNLFGHGPTSATTMDNTPASSAIRFGSATSTAPASNLFAGYGPTTNSGAINTSAATFSTLQSTGQNQQGLFASFPAATNNMFGAPQDPPASTSADMGSLFPSGQATTQGGSGSVNFVGGGTGNGSSDSLAPKADMFGMRSSTITPATTSLFPGFTTNATGPSLFQGYGPSAQSETTSTPAPSVSTSAPGTNSLFAGFAPSTSAPSLFKGYGASTPSESSSTPATAANLPNASTFEASKTAPATEGNLFGTLAPTDTAAPMSIFSGISANASANNATTTAAESTSLGANAPAKTNVFNYGTSRPSNPQTASKEPATEALKSTFGTNLFSSVGQAPQSSNIFKQDAFKLPPTNSDASKNSASLFGQQSQKSSTTDEPSSSSTAVGPVDNTYQPLFQSWFDKSTSSAKQQTPSSPASNMPTLTGAAVPPLELSEASAIPKIPKIHVSKNWSVSKGAGVDINELIVQLACVNENYRAKLVQLPSTADWTSLSQWHHRETTEIMKKIAATKKQLAAAKGITGNESSLSTKRKVNEESSSEIHNTSPSKKPRAGGAPNTSTSTSTSKSTNLFSTTPPASPPTSQTSNLFGNVLSNKSSNSTSGNLSASKTVGSEEPAPPRSASAQPSFQTSTFGSYTNSGAKTESSQSSFKSAPTPNGGSSSAFGGASSLFTSTPSGKKKEESTSVFKASAPTKASGEESSNSSLFPGFAKPASGATSLFNTRPDSPAPSIGGSKSVFATPEIAQAPSPSNIFSHLSPDPSSINQDDDDDDDDEDEEGYQSGFQSQLDLSSDTADPKKRKMAESESGSEESLEEVMRRKKQDTSTKPSLFSRMTKADDSELEAAESDKENGNQSSDVGKTNGVQTPKKPFAFFDFGGAAAISSAPPKQDSFAGDQTFKAGTPIKFGTAVKTNPTFQFQPATPSLADLSATPSKPSASTFSFLNPNGQSGTASIASALSSRAATPMSETENSATENDDEEGEAQEQLDLSALTAEEKADNDVLFHTEQCLAKHQVEKKPGVKSWDNYARGPLWILKNKESGKAFVRMRLSSGATMLNYNILPKLKTAVTGNSKKMVSAVGTKKDGKTGNIFFAVKTSEAADELSKVYNSNLPS